MVRVAIRALLVEVRLPDLLHYGLINYVPDMKYGSLSVLKVVCEGCIKGPTSL